jgi:hypothetical protein
MPKKASRMNLAGAPSAGRHGSKTAVAVKGKCSLLFVQLAGRKPRFHSVLPEKDLFIAANVSGKEDKDKWCC